MGSKASGEPSLLLSVSILHALRAAVKAARREVGAHRPDSWPTMPAHCLKYNRRICEYLSRIQWRHVDQAFLKTAMSDLLRLQAKANSFPEYGRPAGPDTPNLQLNDGAEKEKFYQAIQMLHAAADLRWGDPSSPGCAEGTPGSSRAGEGFVALPGPASVIRLREACGPYSAAKILRAALQEAELEKQMDGWLLETDGWVLMQR